MARLPRETDLYPHIKRWLENQGYTVHAEVKSCDVAAVKGDQLVLIEIKRTVNIELIYQIIRRQAARALVYGALPAPKSFEDKKWANTIRLFKRLEAGLMVVYVEPDPRVEVLLHPVQREVYLKSTTRAYFDEIQKRTLDVNLGGSPGWDNMDSRKENALRIAVAIERFGPSSVHVLSLAGASSMTRSILRYNKHGWFERTREGVYDLTDEGRAALTRYADLADIMRAKLNGIASHT